MSNLTYAQKIAPYQVLVKEKSAESWDYYGDTPFGERVTHEMVLDVLARLTRLETVMGLGVKE